MLPGRHYPALLIWASLAALLTSAAVVEPLGAQDDVVRKRIIDRDPFDKITLNKQNNDEEIETKLIGFPGRLVPENPKPSEKVKVKLYDDDTDYEVEWFNIARIDLYEQMVLAEANKLVEDKKLDEAFDYFVKLVALYPKTPGLKQSHERYLYRCVGDAFRRGKHDEALAVVEELYALNGNYKETEASPPVLSVLGQVADKVIGTYVEKQDYNSAKTLLRRLETKYSAGQEPFAKKWRASLSQIATGHRDVSRAHLAAGRFIEAYDACAQMMSVWPQVEGGPELAAEIAQRYPLVIVGVSQPAVAPDPRSLNNPAARRTGRLVQRRLMEFAGMGPEGGKYSCSLGTVTRSDDGLKLSFTIKPENPIGSVPLTGYDVSRHLLQLADPADAAYQPAWARLVTGVKVRNVELVDASLRLPHVLPEAFLQTSYFHGADSGQLGAKGSGPYFVFSRTADVTRFTKNDAYPQALAGQPAEVMERFFTDRKGEPDPQRALLALQRGEIDVLDQVFPGDVPALSTSSEVVVSRYSVPTTHFLTIGRKHPYLTNRTFRRALVYGCDREAILRQGLMRGGDLPGYRVVSAPFPAPVDSNDSLCYGYDELIPARPYDPKLALILRILSQREVKAVYENRMEPLPPLTPLVLGHPKDEISRIVCRALARQWKVIGIETTDVEFPLGVFADEKQECDLVYIHGAAWEPVVDAARIFGTGGLNPAENTFVNLVLRRIESAQDWGEARLALKDLHRIVNEEVTVLPLFQTFDYYAYRRSVKGLTAGQVSLYQNVENWQVAPRLAIE